MPKSRFIAPAMLDLQILGSWGEGRGIPSYLDALSTLPNLPLLLKSKMAAIVFAGPNNTLALQASEC